MAMGAFHLCVRLAGAVGTLKHWLETGRSGQAKSVILAQSTSRDAQMERKGLCVIWFAEGRASERRLPGILHVSVQQRSP